MDRSDAGGPAGRPGNPALQGAVVPRTGLTDAEVERLYRLFEAHYDRVSPGTFRADLGEKDWVILLREPDGGEIRGFSTLKLDRIEFRGAPLRTIFSGDTIIDPKHWGEQVLVKCWCRFMGTLLVHEPQSPLYWFLLTKGYRTYLFLPLYFHEFHPRPGAGTPAQLEELVDTLARRRYGGAWDRTTGLIEFPTSHGQLATDLAGISPHRREDPHVRFFLERNPRYRQGAELVCLARIAPANMRGLGRRMLELGMREPLGPDRNQAPTGSRGSQGG